MNLQAKKNILGSNSEFFAQEINVVGGVGIDIDYRQYRWQVPKSPSRLDTVVQTRLC